MATVVLNVYTSAYPLIINRIRASVFLQSSPQALITQQTDATVGHPIRIWSFPGLPRNNYGFSLDEVDNGGNVVTNLALFDVVPGQTDGLLHRADEQIQVGHTAGFVAGNNIFTFNGTGGTPDYRTWEIVPSELTGRGILVRGVDYSWDSLTGTFTLLRQGDIFTDDVFYNIHFEDQVDHTTSSTPTVLDSGIEVITFSTALDISYFGKTILVEPAGNYIEITLPDLVSVPQGRRLFVEVSPSAVCCVRFITTNNQTIRFGNGNLYALPNESFSIYRAIRANGNEYRVSNAFGNFLSRGRIVFSDEDQSDAINMHRLDGAAEDTFQYARIYFDFVKSLPLNQVCNFDDWSIGENKYLFSFANSASPLNLNKFHFPDRRGIYVVDAEGTQSAGQFLQQQLLSHSHPAGTAGFKKGGFGNGSYHGVSYAPGNEGDAPFNLQDFTQTVGGTTNRPNSYTTNSYIIL